MNRIGTVVVSLLLVLQGACQPSAPTPPAVTSATNATAAKSSVSAAAPVAVPAAPQALLSWHAAGLNAVTNSAEGSRLKDVLALPQTVTLKSNILAKLSQNLPAILFPEAPPVKEHAAKLKPLLEDVLAYESKVIWASESPLRWRVAVKIPVERTGIWSANLHDLIVRGELVEKIPRTNITDNISVVSYSPAETYRYGLKDGWVTVERAEADFAWEIFKDKPILVSNVWLALDVPAKNLPLAQSVLDTNNLPYLRLTVEGKKEDQISRLSLKFPKALSLALKPWNVPTNTIKDPIISFTAMRGVEDIWPRIEALKPFGLPKPPDQLYIWGQPQLPFQSYLAVPVSGASNFVQSSLTRWTNEIRTAFSNEMAGRLTIRTNELYWTGLMGLIPFLKAAPEPRDDHLLFGLGLMAPSPADLPDALLQQFVNGTNLVYYDWEITEARLTQWLQCATMLYMAANRVPIHNGTAPYQWAVAIAPKLGNTVTQGELASADEIKVFRKSPVGLSGIELYLLFRWLDQKSFPKWDAEAAPQFGVPALPMPPSAPAPVKK